MENYPRGSEWRRWDLHVHTPETQKNDNFVGNDSAEKWDLFYKTIEEYIGDGSDPSKNIAVIGITDYLSIENYLKVVRDKRLPESIKLILPNVELRITPISRKGPTNIHCIFNPEIADKLENCFFCNLKVSYKGIEYSATKQRLIDYGKIYSGDSNIDDKKAMAIGIDQFVVQENALEEVFKNNPELRDNVIIVVPNSNQDGASGITQNGDYYSENGSQLDASKRVIYQLADMIFSGNPNDVSYFLGEGKDNRDTVIRKYGSLKPCIHGCDAHCNEKLFEPDMRRYCWIKADPTFEGLKQLKYEPEFRVRIHENMPEMKNDYQVIEAIEIKHDDFGEQRIEFNQNLNTIIGGRSSGKSILLGAIAKLANYKGEIKDKDDYNQYMNNIVNSMELIWKDHEELTTRKVEYFPQTYINNLAANSENTIKLVEDILKGDDERKRAFEVYETETSKNTVNISNEIEKLIKLQYRLQEVSEEIISTGDLTGIRAEINKISKQIDTVRGKNTVKLTEEEEQAYTALKEKKRELQDAIVMYSKEEIQLIQLKSEKLVKDIGGDFIGLSETVKNEFIQKLADITAQVDSTWEEFVNSKIDENKKTVSDAESKIKAIESDKRYVNGESFYKENEALSELNSALEAEKAKENQILELMNKQRELNEEIKKQKMSIFQLQMNFLDIANNLSGKVRMEKDEIRISPKVVLARNVFLDVLETNFRKMGYIKELYDFVYENETQFIEILRSLLEKFEKGELTIKNGRDKKQVVLNLLSSNYYRLFYNVEYQGDNLNSMSEGKKAFVILRMLLDFSDNQCPILIDQPEDDLDNRAIYNDLVAYLRKKKRERQIILVTHNPNIVVTGDAEEVIVANQHGVHNENKDGIKFCYCSGSIENSFKNDDGYILSRQGIREHICEILEGGDVAFLKRESKYSLKE